MSTPDPAGLNDGPPAAQDPTVAVTALVLRERQTRDRQWWDEMAQCYTPDATIAMSWFDGPAAEFIQSSRSMNVGGSRGLHRLSPPAVRVHENRALAELPLVIEFRTNVDGVEADLCSFARSQYRAARTRGVWRISAITTIYERDTLTPSIPGTVLPLSENDFTGLRPPYRCLAWHLRRSGYDVPDDLPGDDRPTAVAVVHDADVAWLHAGESPSTPGHAPC